MAGKFIVFEGLDGSGQSTQVRLLAEYLISKGKTVLTTKEPTETSDAGKEIIAVLTHQKTLGPKELQELFSEDRRTHLEEVILPQVKQGTIVISDRYRWSTYAFGSLACDPQYLRTINQNFPEPDLTIYLKVSPDVSLERIAKRGKPVELFEKREKLEKVALAYGSLTEEFPDCLVVDGERSIEEVHLDVVSHVDKILA